MNKDFLGIVKVFFIATLSLFTLLILFVAGFIIFTQMTKPKTPTLEQLSSNFSLLITQKHNPEFTWVPRKEISPILIEMFIQQNSNALDRSYEIRDLISSSFCYFYDEPTYMPSDMPHLTPLGQMADIFISINLYSHEETTINDESLWGSIRSNIDAIHTCALTNDLKYQLSPEEMAEINLNIHFFYFKGLRIKHFETMTQFYFDKSPLQLSMAESAIIVNLDFHSFLYTDNTSEYWIEKSCQTLKAYSPQNSQNNCEEIDKLIHEMANKNIAYNASLETEAL